MNTRLDAALVLWNTDVIQLVSLALQHRNLKAGGIEPSQDTENIEDLILSCDPSVVVFDIGPPYKSSTAIVRHLIGRFPDRAFVFTSADPALAIRAAQWLSCHPVLQKPYDLDEIVEIVRRLANRVSRCVVEENIVPVSKSMVSSNTAIVV